MTKTFCRVLIHSYRHAKTCFFCTHDEISQMESHPVTCKGIVHWGIAEITGKLQQTVNRRLSPELFLAVTRKGHEAIVGEKWEQFVKIVQKMEVFRCIQPTDCTRNPLPLFCPVIQWKDLAEQKTWNLPYTSNRATLVVLFHLSSTSFVLTTITVLRASVPKINVKTKRVLNAMFQKNYKPIGFYKRLCWDGTRLDLTDLRKRYLLWCPLEHSFNKASQPTNLVSFIKIAEFSQNNIPHTSRNKTKRLTKSLKEEFMLPFFHENSMDRLCELLSNRLVRLQSGAISFITSCRNGDNIGSKRREQRIFSSL